MTISRINLPRFVRTFALLAMLGAAPGCGPNNGASIRVSREAAQSWNRAAREILKETCGLPTPTDRQISTAEESLRNRNANCSAPVDCDIRLYNKLRSDVEIALPAPLTKLCGTAEAVPASAPAIPPINPVERPAQPDAEAEVAPPQDTTTPDVGTPDTAPVNPADTATPPETTGRPPRDGGRRPPRPRDTGTPVIPLP